MHTPILVQFNHVLIKANFIPKEDQRFLGERTIFQLIVANEMLAMAAFPSHRPGILKNRQKRIQIKTLTT